MRVISLPRRAVDRFGSTGVSMDALPTPEAPGEYAVRVARLDAGGSIGRHPAVLWQVLAVVEGSGRVAGPDGVRRPISTGQAAVWGPEEQHQTWAESAMTVVIVESTDAPRLDDRFPPVPADFTDTPRGR